MKGRDQGLQQRASAHQLFHALGHLTGCFVGECDRQDGIRRDAHILDHVGDAVSDSARVSTAGPGQHQHWAFNGFCRLALLGIELVEQVRTSSHRFSMSFSVSWASFNRCFSKPNFKGLLP